VKILSPAPRFMIWAAGRALRHPKTPVTYFYCPACRIRFHARENECPRCHDEVKNTPERRQQSPVPWYCSVTVIALGVISLVLDAAVPIPGLGEVGRALVYVPLGNMFGLTLRS